MKKAIALLLAAVVILGLFAGCADSGTAEVKDEPAKSPVSDKTDTKTESEPITVYSPAPAEPLAAGVAAFTEATGIQVNVVAAGTGELLKRVESESAKPLCDVVWGGGAESMQAYSQYFQGYASTEDAFISDQVKDQNGLWIGESPVPVVIMYNKALLEQLGVDIPTSWEDLLNPKLKGMIAYADPAKSGSAFTLLCTMVTAFGKDDGKGWEFIAKLYENLDGKIQGSSANSYKLVADGEYAIGLTQEKSVQEYIQAGDTNVGYVYPKEGTSAVPDAIAIVKDCPNPEGAKAFVDFILSNEAQKMQAEQFNRRPARTDLEAPNGLPKLEEIPLVDYDFEWAGNSKAEIVAKWQEIVVG